MMSDIVDRQRIDVLIRHKLADALDEINECKTQIKHLNTKLYGVEIMIRQINNNINSVGSDE